MKIVYFQARLGNQLFQYAFFKYLQRTQNSNIYLDNTAPFIRKNGKIDIEIAFPAVAGSKFILPYYKARPFYLLGDVLKKVFKINYQTDIEHPDCKKIWWKGYWQEYQYPEYVKDELLHDLQFAPLTDQNNIETVSNIFNTNSVSIHIRRGDYLRPDIRAVFGDICTLDYYKQAVEYISKNVNEPRFFIFSDDIQWVKENLCPANAVYVNWNTGRNSFRDLQLMSLCKHNIIANSTFSWWGAWLNRNTNKLVVCPAKWTHNCSEEITEKLLPPKWYRIDC